MLESVNVNLDGCPAVHIANPACQLTVIEEIYRGNGQSTLDFDLLPFTGVNTLLYSLTYIII